MDDLSIIAARLAKVEAHLKMCRNSLREHVPDHHLMKYFDDCISEKDEGMIEATLQKRDKNIHRRTLIEVSRLYNKKADNELEPVRSVTIKIIAAELLLLAEKDPIYLYEEKRDLDKSTWSKGVL